MHHMHAFPCLYYLSCHGMDVHDGSAHIHTRSSAAQHDHLHGVHTRSSAAYPDVHVHVITHRPAPVHVSHPLVPPPAPWTSLPTPTHTCVDLQISRAVVCRCGGGDRREWCVPREWPRGTYVSTSGCHNLGACDVTCTTLSTAYIHGTHQHRTAPHRIASHRIASHRIASSCLTICCPCDISHGCDGTYTMFTCWSDDDET